MKEGKHKQGHAKDPIYVKFKEFRDAHLVKAAWKNRDMVTAKIRGVITTGVVIKRVMGASRMLSSLSLPWCGG